MIDSPSTMSTRPATLRRSGMYWARPAAANVAVTPRTVNTMPKPRTYAVAWRRAVQRDGGAPTADAATATAVSWPR